MKHTVYPVCIALVILIFFWKVVVYGLMPIPADTIIGLYHPYRDLYAAEYPNGIPYKNFLITDPVRQQYPWRQFGIDELKHGRLPIWNPYEMGGTPHIGNLQSAVFYPLNIIFLIVPFHYGWTLLVILQPLLSAWFMYLFLRSLKMAPEASFFGAIVYAFSGFSISWLTWNTVGHVALYLPLILYLKDQILRHLQKHIFDRKAAGFLVALVAVESSYLLAGHLQTAFYAWVISNIYLIARVYQTAREMVPQKRTLFLKRIGVFFSGVTISVAILISVQAYTLIQFIIHSARATDQAAWQSTEGWFIPWQHLIQFVAPDFFGNPATLNYWGTWNYGELVGYVGIPGLLLSITALFLRRDRKTVFFGTVLIASLVFATPTLIAKLPYILRIPLIATSQPTRLLFVVDFSLAVLASLGLDYAIRQKIGLRKLIGPLGMIGFILLGLWIVVIVGYYLLPSISLDDWATAKRNLVLPSVLFISSVILLMTLVYRNRREKMRTIAVCGILVLTIFDLTRFGWKYTPFSPAAYIFPETKITTFLKSHEEPFRIMATDKRILPPNFPMQYRIESIDGYDPLFSSNFSQLASAWVRGKPDISPYSFNRIITIENYESRLADLFNVRYVLSLTDIDLPKLTKVFEEGETRVYENTSAYPRAFLVESVVTVNTNQNVVNALFDETIDLQKTGVLTEDLEIDSVPLSENEYARIVSHNPQEVVVETGSRTRRLLIVSDVYYPSWHAYVDAVATKLYRVDYALRGVVVPAGTHTITFSARLL